MHIEFSCKNYRLRAIVRRQSLKQFSRSICNESNGNRTTPASHFHQWDSEYVVCDYDRHEMEKL